MGIYSDRQNVKRYTTDSRIWAKRQEFDYEEIYELVQAITCQYYLDQANGVENQGPVTKIKKLNP